MNEQEIMTICQEELEIVLLIVPQKDWIHQFKEFKFNNTKSSFGTMKANGTIFISRVFLNTREYIELRDTIRHELAHLIVGVHQQHNYIWQQKALQIGCKATRIDKAEGKLAINMKRKWRLIGVLEDGIEIQIQNSHNKMSKYLKYKPELTKYCRCAQGKIVKFYYKRNKS